MLTPRVRYPVLLVIASMLAACGGKGGDLAPHEVVTNSAAALRANDLQAFLKISLPAAEFANMKAQWAARKDEPVTEADKAEYEQTMTRLTQDGAVDKIMTELKPQLVQMEQQMPMMIGLFSGIAQASLAQSEELTAEQRAQAQKALTALSGWAMRTDLASPELARQAVEVAVETARELELPTVEAVRALSFEEMLGKGSTVLAGTKDLLAVYDLNVNQVLDSTEAETINQTDNEATVRTEFTFLDTTQTLNTVMVKQGEQWVAKEALEQESEDSAWVTADRLNLRTCPDESCGIVSAVSFGQKVKIYEERNGWARISKYYDASCRDGRSEYVVSGNDTCEPPNGINDGRLAEWAPLQYLSSNQPDDPAAGATGDHALVRGSDDYRIYKDVFARAASELIKSDQCTRADFEEMGGWMKSTKHRDQPIYFTYCGGMQIQNRLYLNASTGEISR